MPSLSTAQILDVTVKMGISKANQPMGARFVNTILAGMYIAIGGFLAIRIGLTLPWDTWGGMGKFMFGAVFPLGLLLVVVCGADLFTGSCMTLTTAKLTGHLSLFRSFNAGFWAWMGNFVGALFVAYVLAYSSGIIMETVSGSMPWANAAVSLANGKCHHGFWETLIRGIGCNWLVCLAVFAAAASTEISGKIIALWFPTMAFVALGMEHCIANMFFIPLALFVGHDARYLELVEQGKAVALNCDWSTFFINNLVPATIGNIIGGAVLVGMFYLVAVRKN